MRHQWALPAREALARRVSPALLGAWFAWTTTTAGAQPPSSSADSYAGLTARCEDAESRQEYLQAARCWHSAAASLSENSNDRAPREHAVLGMMSAYKSAFEQNVDVAVLDEALTKYAGYVDEFVRAYGSDAGISPELTIRARLFTRLKTKYGLVSVERVEVPVRIDDTAVRRLQIAGTAAVSASAVATVMFVVGGVFGRRYQESIDGRLTEAEAQGDPIYLQGMAYNRLMLGSGIAAGVLLTTGAVLLGLAAAKKKRERPPVQLTGFGLQAHF